MLTDNHFSHLANIQGIPLNSIKSVYQLLEDKATIPFIARYRKEVTGGLDEVKLEQLAVSIHQLQDLERRKSTIITTITELGQLTPQLEKQILSCYSSRTLEDIYLPFKPKRKTRASIARDNGLEPLAKALYYQQDIKPFHIAKDFTGKHYKNTEEVLQAARDIIAEWIAEDKNCRDALRYIFEKHSVISAKLVKGKEEEGQKYRDYFDYNEKLNRCPSHRLLAIRRAESEGILKVKIQPDPERTIPQIGRQIKILNGPCKPQILEALEDSYKRLLMPAIETEFKNLSKEKADQEAILVFRNNLKQLLLQPPLGSKVVLALDPGFRTGCKVVVLNNSGDLLKDSVIYPHPPQQKELESQKTIVELKQKYKVEVIAVGNGTAGRETVKWLKSFLSDDNIDIFLVNEDGASVYSASKIAREEFPNKDITVRGAVSIGRRLMDPLAELVKIDAKSIGVGQYQHDVDQKLLKDGLDQTVINCVNAVGVNLNTASKHLLAYVSGLGPALAQNIIDYRQEINRFRSRHELLKVQRLGEKAYEQCAGFLRIKDGTQVLDNTAIHPERYILVIRMAKDIGLSVDELIGQPDLLKKINVSQYIDNNTGLETITDIVKELEKPGLDIRGQVDKFEFAEVYDISDLYSNMELPGKITNLTNFGAFVDIGIKQDGMIHISQMTDQFISNPAEVVSLGENVLVRILEVDQKRNRIQLKLVKKL